MPPINLSPEGDVLDAAMVVFQKHLDTHHCDHCLDAYQTFIKAMTEWINRKVETNQKEESYGSQEKEPVKEEVSGPEETAEPPKDFLNLDEPESIPQDDWDILK